MNKAQGTRRIRTNVEGYLFILPWLVGYLVFQLGPMLYSLVLSFTRYSMFTPMKWVGLENYWTIFFDDPRFWQALKVTTIFVVIYVPARLVLTLLLAMLLNQNIRGVTFYRAAYYLPSIVGGSVAVTIVWKFLLSPKGPVNASLMSMGLKSVPFLTSPTLAIYSMVLMELWTLGSAMVIFLAGIKAIPREMYEASAVDGAGPVRQIFQITLPLLSPVIFFNLVMTIINAFQVFTQAFVATGGGPLDSTLFYVLYLYQKGFKSFQFGYASALAWVLFAVIMLITLLVFRSSSLWVFYENEVKGEKG